MGKSPVKLAVLVALFVSGACDPGDPGAAKKKSMPDLHYACALSDDELVDRDAGIARMLEIYASDPLSFGDPVAVVDSFADPVQLIPGRRIFALILSDSSWIPTEGMRKGTIAGGPVISISLKNGSDDLQSRWIEMSEYIRANGYTYLPPGIEIYRGYGSEFPGDSTEIIIRIE